MTVVKQRSTQATRGFLDVDEVRIPRSVAEDLIEFLRERGSLQVEAVGFWAGVRTERIFEVKAALIPSQEAYATQDGLAVVISGEALFEMNVQLHHHSWSIIAQVHSHPRAAYHSETDDQYAVVTKLGAFSIVIPDFAQGPINQEGWAVHRLMTKGNWTQLSLYESKAPLNIRD